MNIHSIFIIKIPVTQLNTDQPLIDLTWLIVEDRISPVEDTIEEIDSSVKGNVKSNKILTQNVKVIWETMKQQNLRE